MLDSLIRDKMRKHRGLVAAGCCGVLAVVAGAFYFGGPLAALAGGLAIPCCVGAGIYIADPPIMPGPSSAFLSTAPSRNKKKAGSEQQGGSRIRNFYSQYHGHDLVR